jgi:RNA polymerase sigma-70 factor, ECF subfamily
LNFRAVYDENVGFVFRTLDRFGVPERLLPDGAQEVFTVAFRSQDRFEGRSSLRTWLFGIARRVASDMRRSAAARHEVLDDSSSADVPDSKRDIAVWAERSEALAKAERLLRSLPEEQAVAFALFEIEEWTGAEIAAAYEVSVATVHSRLRLAREAIQKQLKDELAKREPASGETSQ